MLLTAAPAAGAGAANVYPAAATASDAGCPRLTGGAVRLEDPILDSGLRPAHRLPDRAHPARS